ncbi:MAG: thiosulfate oxidation carrier complex protein SoxZ [Burkholderiaceae bacterium]|nr:thiosulfate oxidation carrier complex protein SoxZ [Burkholderiaceae bacterium]
MASPMRIRATESGGVVDVKVLMSHIMETGQRKDASGNTIPAWVDNKGDTRTDETTVA